MSSNPVTRLLQSINRSAHAADLLDKLGEVGLDSLLDNELLKEIPIIGTAITILKAGDDFRAYAFTKKIALFLKQVEKIPIEDRDNFFKSHCETPEKLAELGESTLMVLDSIDHPLLAQMYGRAFAIMLKGDEGAKLLLDQHAFIIKNLNPYLLRTLDRLYQSQFTPTIDYYAGIALSNYGLIRMLVLSQITNSTSLSMAHEKTEFGEKFYRQIVQGLIDD